MTENAIDGLARLEAELDRQILKTRRERRLVILVGMTLWLFVIGYFSYFTNQIKAMVQPKVIAGYIAGQLAGFVTDTSRTQAKTIERLAPTYAAQVFAMATERLPLLRREAQMFLLGWFEDRFVEIEHLMVRVLDDVVKDHLKDLAPLVENIHTPEGKKALEAYLTGIIAAPLDEPEMKAEIENVNTTLDFMVKRLARLAKGEGLNAEEQRERELMLAFREMLNRMQ